MSTPPHPAPEADDGLPADRTSRDKTEDQRSFVRTLRAFKAYAAHATAAMEHRRRDMLELSDRHRELLGGDVAIEDIFQPHRASIAANQAFLDAVVAAAGPLFESYWPDASGPPPAADEPSALDMEKVYSTLRQCVRDWGEEGRTERGAVYGPVANVLLEQFPDIATRGNVRVLVPGAGLSRLSVELCTLGFSAQGNEFSYHMLIAGHYLMNHAQASGMHVLRPFCDATINVFSRADQHRAVAIPDVSTFDHLDMAEQHYRVPFGELSMVAGDFVEVYSKPAEHGAWDALVTCFFIDTAHNIVEYMEVMHRLLRPGAVWVNCGPLLFHFSDTAGQQSIDVTLEELRALADRVGFDLQHCSTIQTAYTNNPRSMKQMVYQCPFFWARRR